MTSENIENLQLAEDSGTPPDVHLEMRNRGGWLPIESAPKDGTPIFIGRPEIDDQSAVSTLGWWQEAEEDGVDYMGADAGFVDFEFQNFHPGRSFGNPSHRYEPCQPTRWQPLPPPPKD